MSLGYAQKNLTATTGDPSTVVLSLSNYGTVAIQLSGTFTATTVFETTVNNVTWVALAVVPVAGGAAVTGATAVGAWVANCGGLAQVRVRCSAFTSGVISASIGASVTQGTSLLIPPTTDPAVAGAIWNDAGTLSVSAG